MGAFWRDFLFSLRLFRRSPGLAAGVAVTIGLGVGGSLAISGLLRGGLIAASPFRDSANLVIVENTGRYHFGGFFKEGLLSPYVSIPDYEDLEAQAKTLSQVGASTANTGIMTGGDRPRPIWRTLVTAKLLSLLAPHPRLGRLLQESDFKPGAPAVAMLTESMWRAHFGSEAAVVGRAIQVDDQPFMIVGILPDEALRFLRQPDGVLEEDRTEYVVSPLLPAMAGAEARLLRYSSTHRDAPSVRVAGRIAPGRSLAEVRSEVAVIAQRLAMSHPETNKERGLRAHALDDWRTTKVRGTINILLAAGLLVLLVACSNAAGLVIADSVRHETEMAVRQALGAAPSRLVTTELTRAVVLALPGGLLAVVLSAVTLTIVDRVVGDGTGAIPRTLLIPRVLATGALCTLLAGLVSGGAASWSMRRRNVAEALKEGGLTASFGRRRHLAMRVFVAVQVAGATSLVLGAGLMLRSVWNILAVDIGFDVRHGLVMQMRLPPSRYPKGADQRAFMDAALLRVRAVPGVIAAGVAIAPPLTSASQSMSGLELETPTGIRGPLDHVNSQSVTPGYLEALDMKLLRGRWFSDSDARSESSAAMVDQTFCRTYLAGTDPLTVKVRFNKVLVPVVGVVGDVRKSGPLHDIQPTYRTLYLGAQSEREGCSSTV
jgi:putative ABC transport system permease protein